MYNAISDLHIGDFCKDTAKILLMLYKRFPRATTLYVEDISGPDTPDEFGLHSARFEAGFSTLLWLKEHDYIVFSDTVKQEAVEEACLTHRGFVLLSSFDYDFSPESEELDSTSASEHKLLRRVDRIKSILKQGNSEQIQALILQYMIQSRELKP